MTPRQREYEALAEKAGLKIVRREEKKSHLFLILENKDGMQMKFPVSQKTRLSNGYHGLAEAQFRKFSNGILHNIILVNQGRVNRGTVR